MVPEAVTGRRITCRQNVNVVALTSEPLCEGYDVSLNSAAAREGGRRRRMQCARELVSSHSLVLASLVDGLDDSRRGSPVEGSFASHVIAAIRPDGAEPRSRVQRCRDAAGGVRMWRCTAQASA